MTRAVKTSAVGAAAATRTNDAALRTLLRCPVQRARLSHRIATLREVLDGIHRFAARDHLEVQVGSRGEPARSNGGDRLVRADGIADVHEHLLTVRVSGDDVARVLDLDGQPEADAIPDVLHPTRRRRVDARA